MDLKSYWNKGISFSNYFELAEKQTEEGRTSGENQEESLVAYSKMNFQRMKKWVKTGKISEELTKCIKESNQKLSFLVITETWCGDAAQNIPFLAKMVELNPNWEMKLVFRDENEALINQYLTNGGKAIPKVIVMDEMGNELFNWGPRPALAQKLVVDYKNKPEPKEEYAVFAESLHLWYAKNRGVALQEEWQQILKEQLVGVCQ